MKWVFAVLVLVNLGFWLWASGIRQPEDQAVVSARPALAPEKMRLLSEPGVRLAPRPKPQPPPARPAAPEAAGAQQARRDAAGACYRIGPFADAESADQAGVELTKLQIGFVREVEEQRRVVSQRVYLPPFPTKEAAEAKRKELTRLGFRDHALIEEEGMQHAISLGVFSVQANAHRHMKALAAKGIEARIEPFYQIRTGYWLLLHLDQPTPDRDPLAALREHSWQAPNVKLVQAACPRTGEIAAKPEPPAGP
jgi:hypothetical protein